MDDKTTLRTFFDRNLKSDYYRNMAGLSPIQKPTGGNLRGLLKAFGYDPDKPDFEYASERERDFEQELNERDQERDGPDA